MSSSVQSAGESPALCFFVLQKSSVTGKDGQKIQVRLHLPWARRADWPVKFGILEMAA